MTKKREEDLTPLEPKIIESIPDTTPEPELVEQDEENIDIELEDIDFEPETGFQENIIQSEEDVFVFPKDQSVATISIAQLRRSAKVLKAGTNNPGKTRPIQSWQFIDQIQALLIASGNTEEVEIDRLFVYRKSSSRILTVDQENVYDEGNTPIEHWVFNHVVGKIIIGSDKDINPSIAFSFNKMGISIAYGENVQACSNLFIFGKFLMATYGKEPLPFSKMMKLLEYWIANIKQMHEKNMEVISDMEEEFITTLEFEEQIGKMYIAAINKAYFQTGDIPVMNTYQLSLMVQAYLADESYTDGMTVWEFYNLGTAVLKSENVVAEDILQANKRWLDYVTDTYLLF